MVRYYETVQNYKYNWNQVALAFWCRYPNPCSKHVLTEDVLERYVDDDGSLCSRRLLSKTSKPPKWIEGVLPSRVVYIIEDSVVSPENKTLVTNTRNIGMKNFLTISERVVYKPNPENLQWTLTDRKACINSTMFGLSRPIKAFAFEKFKRSCAKTYEGFQLVLETMFANKNKDTISQFNPVLRRKLMERAKSITSTAKPLHL